MVSAEIRKIFLRCERYISCCFSLPRRSSTRITRNIDPGKNPIHCFSSHFFTTLLDEGVDNVTKWTAKKGINIFEKKFVFIPVNQMLHWSLCVVVNPGHISNKAEEGPKACLLFLDSLKAHRKKKISKLVRKWLNSEWRRIHSTEEAAAGSGPFASEEYFRLLDPKSKWSSVPSIQYCALERSFSFSLTSSLSRQQLGLRCVCLSLCLCGVVSTTS